jgi:adenylate kinase family enzyme
MDGNYGGTIDARLAACDTVIFLDLSRLRCLWRVLARRLRYHGQSRPDMAADCPEHLDWEFVRWIWNYPRRTRPQLLQKLAALRDEKRVIVLRTPRDVSRFLASTHSAPQQ